MVYRRYGYGKKHEVIDAGPSVGAITPGVANDIVFKVHNRNTGFFWTGKANNQEFYTSEGASWKTAEEARQAIEAILDYNNGGKHARRRLEVRLAEVKHWDIVEARVRVDVASVTSEHVRVEDYEILKRLSQQTTLAHVFLKAMKAQRSDSVAVLLHLSTPSAQAVGTLNELEIPELTMYRHHTVLEFHDYQWATMAKLKLPGTRDYVDVEKMRRDIRNANKNIAAA